METDQELARLFEEDQADRTPREGQPVDVGKLMRRDRERETRVKELYRAQRLRTGADYYRAAMILQHAPAPEDHLLAHELSVVAIAKGEERAKWLAAASEDRFLTSIERSQRFGTQYRRDVTGMGLRLHEVDPAVTDALRHEFDVPPLAEAKAQEAVLNEELKADRDEVADVYHELVRKIRSGEIGSFDQVKEVLGLEEPDLRG